MAGAGDLGGAIQTGAGAWNARTIMLLRRRGKAVV